MLTTLKRRAESAFPGIAIALTIGFAASFLGEHYAAPAMLFALLVLAAVVAIAARNYWIGRRRAPAEPTRNEARFLAQHGIVRIDLSLAAFAAALQMQLTAGSAEPSLSRTA